MVCWTCHGILWVLHSIQCSVSLFTIALWWWSVCQYRRLPVWHYIIPLVSPGTDICRWKMAVYEEFMTKLHYLIRFEGFVTFAYITNPCITMLVLIRNRLSRLSKRVLKPNVFIVLAYRRNMNLRTSVHTLLRFECSRIIIKTGLNSMHQTCKYNNIDYET